MAPPSTAGARRAGRARLQAQVRKHERLRQERCELEEAPQRDLRGRRSPRSSAASPQGAQCARAQARAPPASASRARCAAKQEHLQLRCVFCQGVRRCTAAGRPAAGQQASRQRSAGQQVSRPAAVAAPQQTCYTFVLLLSLFLL